MNCRAITFSTVATLVLTSSIIQLGCSSSSKKDSGSGKSGQTESVKQKSSDIDVSDEVQKSSQTADVGQTGESLDKKYQPMAAALRTNQLDTVGSEAGRILTSNANDAMALNALAIAHFRRGHTGAAKIFLNRAIEKNAPSAGLFNNLGVLLLAEGDSGGAISAFKKALRVNDSHAQALANLGSIYAQGGDYIRALPLLTQSYKSDSSNQAIANNTAVAMRGTGDLAGAKKIYDTILARNSRNVTALLNEATLYIEYMNQPKDGLALVYKVKFLETERKDVLARANALEKKAKAALE
jgi:Flp pilus assembly protein TadD